MKTRLVMSLGHRWRITSIDHPGQWVLERRKGGQWHGSSWCTTRAALERCIRETGEQFTPHELARLHGLPERYPGPSASSELGKHAAGSRFHPYHRAVETLGQGNMPPSINTPRRPNNRAAIAVVLGTSTGGPG